MFNKDTVSRIIKTFIEAAFGYIVVNLGAVAFDLEDPDVTCHALLCLLVSAVAAGISAIWNGIIEPMIKK